jgi:hypothetical protein
LTSWRDTQAVMDASTIATFGELITINGFTVYANVLEDDFDSTGLGLPVEGERASVIISNEDKERVRLSKGVVVEYRGKVAKVSQFQITNTTLWRINLS